jgi:hypothetical protein
VRVVVTILIDFVIAIVIVIGVVIGVQRGDASCARENPCTFRVGALRHGVERGENAGRGRTRQETNCEMKY